MKTNLNCLFFGVYGLARAVNSQGPLDLIKNIVRDASQALTLPIKLFDASIQSTKDFFSCHDGYELLNKLSLVRLPPAHEHCEPYMIKTMVRLTGAVLTAALVAYLINKAALLILHPRQPQPVMIREERAAAQPAPAQANAQTMLRGC